MAVTGSVARLMTGFIGRLPVRSVQVTPPSEETKTEPSKQPA